MVRIIVELGSRSYPIEIESGLIQCVGLRLREMGFSGHCAVVTNPLVKGLYGDALMEGLSSAGGLNPLLVIVPDGEEYKNLEEAGKIYDTLVEHRFERGSPIIALGGGVIGDLAGFVAATYLRGVPYVQVPTTLLAQVDSSVGGKTAVNHPGGKNLIGSFYQPRAVLIDPSTLKTLEKREVLAGLAEVVKYGIILDPSFFTFLEENTEGLLGLDEAVVTEAIRRSCEIKAAVVAEDERETTGRRAVLNLGHTFGHAIEALSGYGVYRHGEAVAMGMVMAAKFSVRLGLCTAEVAGRVEGLLRALGLPVSPPAIEAGEFIESMHHDKKVVGGRLCFVLIEDIGTVVLRDVEEGEVCEFLAF